MLNVTWCGLWLGNDKINYILRQSTRYDAGFGVSVENDRYEPTTLNWNKWHKCTYKYFMVQNETDNYRMTYGSFLVFPNQPAWDSMGGMTANLMSNGMNFSTPDRDNDLSPSNCADTDQSGWWFNNCSGSNVNRWPPQWENDLALYTESYSHIELVRIDDYLNV